MAKACGNLGICYRSTGDYGRARELYEQGRAMTEALGDTAGVGTACNNLGDTLEQTGDLPAAAARALDLGEFLLRRVCLSRVLVRVCLFSAITDIKIMGTNIHVTGRTSLDYRNQYFW